MNAFRIVTDEPIGVAVGWTPSAGLLAEFGAEADEWPVVEDDGSDDVLPWLADGLGLKLLSEATLSTADALADGLTPLGPDLQVWRSEADFRAFHAGWSELGRSGRRCPGRRVDTTAASVTLDMPSIDKTEHAANVSAWRRRRAVEIAALVAGRKSEGTCAVCGEKRPHKALRLMLDGTAVGRTWDQRPMHVVAGEVERAVVTCALCAC